MEGNIDLIRLLSRNGADGTLPDKNGVDALALAKNKNTKEVLIQEIKFSTGERCGSCGISEFIPNISLKRCVNCKATYYCSERCQRKDWREKHKTKCKEFVIGHAGPQRSGILTSYQGKGVRPISTKDVVRNIRQLGSDRFLVKVQVPLVRLPGLAELSVYNEDRSITVSVRDTEPGYEAISRKIVNEGCQVKIKAFFWAHKHGDQGIKIYYGKVGPFQTW